MSAPSLPNELRLALCMRGGVSLAVWMGGACREIAALRSALTESPPAQNKQEDQHRAVYKRLLELAGYNQVTVDVIAGTSAGGLNGALFAAHLVHGMPFDNGIRDIWLRLGDLESLTRHPGRGMTPSLLQGDEKFYKSLKDQLRELVPEENSVGEELRPRFVRLILTATRLFPRSQDIRTSIGAPLLASFSQAHFTFRHQRTFDDKVHKAFTDLPTDSPGQLDKLAYAARATSSFPGAFEPARVTVTTPKSDPEPHRNLVGISSETDRPDGEDGTQAQMMDGGVLDNIPLAWAVRAVASAPAGAPVDRWLFYLEPVPPKAPSIPVWAKKSDSLARLIRTIKAFFRAKTSSETLLEDHAELTTARTAAQRLRGVAGGIPGDPEQASLAAVDQLKAGYQNSVARAEADRLVRLVEDPMGLVAPDPLPIPGSQAFPDDGNQRQILSDLRGTVFPSIALADGDLNVRAFRSPFAAARAVALALDWVRAVEVANGSMKAPSEIRKGLYATRFACEVLLAVRDRLLLRGNNQTSVEAWVSGSSAKLQQLVMDAGPLTADYARWPEVLAEVATSAADLEAEPTGDWGESAFTPIWERVADLCVTFAKQLPKDVTPAIGFRCLHNAARGGNSSMLEALMVAEVLLGPLRPDPLSEPTDIQVHAISAAVRSPLETLLFGGRAPADAELVDRKLSGNQLMNFASFLSSRWRLNDWTWGRLDAAKSLVDVLLREGRFGKQASEEEKPRIREEVRECIGPGVAPGLDKMSTRDLLVTWLHWNILSQEIPLLSKLNKGAVDLPPTTSQLNDLPESAEWAKDAGVLGKVGNETVRGLMRREHLRRAGLRLGLVAWRSLQPASKKLKFTLGLVPIALKPVVLIPLLIGFLTPRLSMVSAVFAWGAVSFATGQIFSAPAHIPVGVGFLAALGSTLWHYSRDREREAWPWIRFGALMLVAVLCVVGQQWLSVVAEFARATGTGVLVLLAVLTSLWGVAGFQLRDGTGWQRLGFVPVAAVVPGGLAGAATLLFAPPGNWWAALVLYGTLAVETLLLTYTYPTAPEPSAMSTVILDSGQPTQVRT